MEEKWKVIDGFDGMYEVSNLGRVKSFAVSPKGKILNGQDTNGYRRVCLGIGERNFYLVHRLVAEYFCEKPSEECNVVNHIDGNKTNNIYTNLEWTTQYYNTHHAIDNGMWENRERTKFVPVTAIDKQGDVYLFESIKDAIEMFGLKESAHTGISSCCRGKVKTAYGYKWAYTNGKGQYE